MYRKNGINFNLDFWWKWRILYLFLWKVSVFSNISTFERNFNFLWKFQRFIQNLFMNNVTFQNWSKKKIVILFLWKFQLFMNISILHHNFNVSSKFQRFIKILTFQLNINLLFFGQILFFKYVKMFLKKKIRCYNDDRKNGYFLTFPIVPVDRVNP